MHKAAKAVKMGSSLMMVLEVPTAAILAKGVIMLLKNSSPRVKTMRNRVAERRESTKKRRRRRKIKRSTRRIRRRVAGMMRKKSRRMSSWKNLLPMKERMMQKQSSGPEDCRSSGRFRRKMSIRSTIRIKIKI